MVALKIVILLKELCTPVYTSIQTADSTANGARKPLTSNTADRKSASRAAASNTSGTESSESTTSKVSCPCTILF